jgi:hypothetical protein
VEIDCAAEQEQQQVPGVGGGAAAAGSFGAQVQQMAQNSVALQIAINQVRWQYLTAAAFGSGCHMQCGLFCGLWFCVFFCVAARARSGCVICAVCMSAW